MNTRILVVALTACLAAACATAPANATSQQCPVDGSSCTGGGPPPIPPKHPKVRQYDDKPELVWFFYRFFRFMRQTR